MTEAIFGQFLILGPRSAVVGIGVDADAAARGEEAGHLYVFGVHQADEVLHDGVDAVFVEVAVVAETEEVELEALALHHAAIGQIADAYFGKVGLAGDGAQTGELRAVEAYPIIVVGVSVLEGLEHLGGIVAAIFGVLTEGLQVVVFAHDVMSLAEGYVGLLFLEILCQYRCKGGGKCASSLRAGLYAGGTLDAASGCNGGALGGDGSHGAHFGT